ncbi:MULTISPECIES: family 43 glycosylhydrolase [unclassified Rathayibacter]|uniref:family 43 glycosylhydrolase n=1 Tax=unclassified Rathayibacter TaxID=2609250 RepID=UPI000F4C2B28|nr:MULTISPECIES: family 43 glycosylhydrolase [unclassified Rathayibacter]ROP48155.1 GH43 family beta-xylosidase [Rathayibacter sp. PhB186]ROS48659.1 GH43 family beta-xylosidase [Rathayibacter sp. PhB185]
MKPTTRWRAALVGALASVVLAAGVALPAVPATAADDLLVRYDFSQLSGTTVPDASGGGRTAILRGSGAQISGSELVLPGGASGSAAAYLELPRGLIDGRDTLTIQAWLRNDTGAGNYAAVFFGTAESPPSQYWLLNPRDPGGHFKSVITASRNPQAPWTTEAGIPASGPTGPTTDASWGLYTTVLQPGKLTGYYNGRLIAETVTNRSVSDLGTDLVGYIGRSSYADPFYKGGVRDFQIRTSALSAQQVADSYWSGVDVGVRTAALASDAAAIDLGPSRVSSDLALPTTGAQGSSIRWTSSDPSRISSTGTVNRPSGSADAAVTLTATLTLGGASTTRDVPLIVAAQNAQADLDALAESIVLRPTLADGELLPTAPAGATLTWRTTTAGVSIAAGAVRTSSTAAVSATVTGELRSGTATTTKTFSVRVLPAGQARYLLAYERTALGSQEYGSNVAYSMHLGLGTTRTSTEALNDNTGVLFADAQPTGVLDVVQTRTLRDPYVFQLATGGYGVLATRTLTNGDVDPERRGTPLYFTTQDLVSYEPRGFVDLGVTVASEPRAVWDSAAKQYRVTWKDAAGADFSRSFTDLAAAGTRGDLRRGAISLPDAAVSTSITGAVPSNLLVVPADTASSLEKRLGRIRNTTVAVDAATVPQGAAVPALGAATLGYSDGSTKKLPVDWSAADLAAVDTTTPGTYQVSGTVRQRDYAAPFLRAEADPDILRWKDRYLFISTDDRGDDQPGMFLRSSPTIDGLRTAADSMVVAQGTAGIAGCYWAPELHDLDGELYIYYSPCIGAIDWQRVTSYVQKLKTGGDPTRLADWETPRPVLKQDGTALQRDAQHPGISLDMTVFQDGGRTYVSWSQRYVTGGVIGDAELWIATIDPANPWRLTSEPRKLVTASYGWETNLTNVAEGATAITHNGKVYLTYSGSGTDRTYAVGLMTAPSGADLTDQTVWAKSDAPLLKSDPAANLWGPGHNSFTVDEDGNEVLVFHARSNGSSNRDTYLRRIHWAADGGPVLDMSAAEEVLTANRTVRATITVQASAVTVTATATTRCISGRAVVTITTRNAGAGTADVAWVTSWGARSQQIGAQKTGTLAITTRAASLSAGTLEGTATVNGATTPVTATYPAARCS